MNFKDGAFESLICREVRVGKKTVVTCVVSCEREHTDVGKVFRTVSGQRNPPDNIESDR